MFLPNLCGNLQRFTSPNKLGKHWQLSYNMFTTARVVETRRGSSRAATFVLIHESRYTHGRLFKKGITRYGWLVFGASFGFDLVSRVIYCTDREELRSTEPLFDVAS